ncbi:VaFE repeat-containing surface-anchored protein [Corynebacterium tuberculostearicum]|uniref:VaFE repeat-containing surface-anchored protein n=1 Tax=Corynebacterium tuberculostearicum TaxID=38304 RepID=UPI0038D11A29
MVFTAVLAAIAVIAAMVTVPGGKAEAAEPTDFVPNQDLGGEIGGKVEGDWGALVWAGPAVQYSPGNKKNNVGWAYCIDGHSLRPSDIGRLFDKENATKLNLAPEYRDAVIGLAIEQKEAVASGDKNTAVNNSVYIAALVGASAEDRKTAAKAITGSNPHYGQTGPDAGAYSNYPGFTGSVKEFTEKTGFEIVSDETPEFKKVFDVPRQPDDYFITIVEPEGNGDGSAQRVMPPDQPGLPDNPDNGGGSEGSTTSPENPDTEENTTEETTSENPEGETSSTETTSDSEPSDSEETTTEDTDEPTPGKTTDVVPNPDPTPTTEKQEKDLNPKIETEASFDGDKQQVVAGATVKDKVHYEGLVQGKKYTLKAELRNKAAGENGKHAILGTGSETFEAKGESGDVEVEIDVDKQLEKPVAAAVAFEKLYSHEVDENGKDAPNDSEDGNLIETHEDIDDEAQTVNTKWNPEIRTEAKFKDGNRVEKGATVIDTVTYKDLVPGKKYTLKAKLISKKDGETVLGEGSAELVPEESAGKQNVEITVNDKADPAVDAAVAFEKLVSTEVDKDGNETSGSTDENVIATHENINDEKQTVNTKWNPSIQTNANFDNAKQVKAGVTVKDTVEYTDLVPGKEYTLKAELRNKAENDKGEHEVVGKGDVTFTPEKSAGEQVVDIKVNDDVEGVIKAAVAFEDLYSKQVDENGKETPNSDEEKKIAEHRNIEDEDQTVTSKMEPSIGTKAEKAKGDEIKAGTVITDTVEYNDLVPGKKYTLNAELRSKVKDDNGEYPVIGHGEKTFVPETSKGTEKVEITVDEGVTEAVDEAVAFEYLTSTAVNKDGEDSTTVEKNDIAEHTDIEDKAQTVKSDKPSETTTPSTTTTDVVPGKPGDGGEGGTSESSAPSSSEETSSSEQSSTVESSTENTETTSSTTKEDTTNESTTSESSSKTTEPTEPTEPTNPSEPHNPGTPGDGDGNEKPHISTNADFANGSKEVVAGATVIDEVDYSNLVVGKEYTLKAELISKEDGESVLGTGEKTFKPETSNGKVEVEITVNDDVTEPVQAAVAFEYLTSTQVNENGDDEPTDEGTPNDIAKHDDINDKDQTVTSKPRISTNADFANGSKEVVAGATVIDTVDYFNLIPGKQYKLNAELISKKDGETVLGKGEATVKPESANGQAEVKITVSDDVKEPVEAAVAFEELTSTDVNDKGEDTPDTTPENPNHIAEHKDIDDENQTVTSHKNAIVSTNADFEGDLREVVAGAEIVDQVSYEGLVPGKEYSLDAQLISKEDGKTVLGETKGHTFKPEAADGTEAVTIVVDDNVTEPVEAAVAFETLTSKVVNDKGEDTPDNDKPNEIGEHKDIDDEDQTVTSEDETETTAPETTTPKENVPGTPGGGDETCESEEPGDSESEQPSESEEPSSSESSEPSESESVEITSSEASETSESDEPSDCGSTTPEKPGEPSEPTNPNEPGTPGTPGNNDEKDTPKVSTNADFEGGLREVVAGAKVVDQVSYEGLVPGKQYALDAQLISKEDGKTVLGETKGHKFTPKSANGTEAVTIVVDEKVTEPVEAAVAFETLTSTEVDKHGEDKPADEDNPNSVGEHKDINDDDQTVTSEDSEKTPKISTNADFEDGSHEVVVGAKIVDEVSYEGLVPGKEYTLKAELISKKDGETVLGEGEATFTPDESEGMVPVTITVNDDVKEPVQAAVAFEELTSTEVDKNGEDKPADSKTPNEIADHKDINDKDQTVTSEEGPKVATNADFEGGLREVVAGAKVVDQVSYEGLVPGKQYALDAQLISKEDGKTVLGETKGHKFTPKSANGTEAVTIVVDEKVTEPVEAAVAFETLTSTQVDKHGEDKPADEDNPNSVGEHKDINDDDQTVTSEDFEKTPKITTNADFEDGSHEVVAGAKIVDEVSYEGLVPGKEYTLKAELINKKDGKSVLGTGEKTFTPKKSKGMVPVTITVNDDVKEPVQAAVAFEELTSTEVNDKGEETPGTTSEKPNHIAEHKDINDDDQTVISHEVHDQDKPGGSSDGSSNGSSKDSKWWLILIPGIGLGKIIKDHFDHKDHGNHNGGHGDNTGNHDGGNGKHTDGHNGGNGHEVKGQDAPQGGNSDNGHGRGVEVQGQEPEETGNALPSNAERVEIKSVPSGATELEPGMQDYIK